MDNTKQQPRPQPPSNDDEIAVAELHINVGNRPATMPLEEPRTGPSLRSTERVTIVYLPRKRFYRVTEKPLNPKAHDVVFYIPETWAIWVPAAP